MSPSLNPPGGVESVLSAISCTSINSCVAAGYDIDASGDDHALFETLSDGTWTPATSADPPDATNVFVKGIQCSSTTSCLAVGFWGPNDNLTESPRLETLSGTTWTESTLGDAGDLLTSLSCPSAGSCMAVGYGTGGVGVQGITETLTDGVWTRGLLPLPAGTGGNGITGVSCPSTIASCVAVGGYRQPPSAGIPDALVETLDNGTWTPTIGIDPSTGYVVPAAVACPTIETCVGVGAMPVVNEHQDSVAIVEPGSTPPTPLDGMGYWLAATDGGIFNFGSATFYGSTGATHLNKPIVGMAATPDGKGYWLVASDGGIFGFGDANFYGSTGAIHLNQPIVGMAATPDGKGYWLVASDGGIFGFGDANFYGSTGAIHLNKPVVGMAATPDGQGYWLVASDGGIFNFGDAAFDGSTGASPLNRPVVGMAETPDGAGYWLVASDGGIFNFGDASFYGSTGAMTLNKPIVSLAASPDGAGYWLVASDGGIFGFGDANFYGSTGALHLNEPVVGMAAS